MIMNLCAMQLILGGNGLNEARNSKKTNGDENGWYGRIFIKKQSLVHDYQKKLKIAFSFSWMLSTTAVAQTN